VHLEHKHVAYGLLSTMLVVMAMSLGGCSKSANNEAAPTPTPPAQQQGVSSKNRVRFKGGVQIASNLAGGLQLERGEVCKELGAYDCASVAHSITLGGVEPYVKTIYSPIDQQRVSTSNAVERMALSACSTRVQRDFSNTGSAILFKDLQAGSAPTETAVAEVATRLYQKLLGRNASKAEIAALVGFASEFKTESEPAKSFALYACFSVATSEEALFL
jgi:hypothetical protein